MQNKYVGDVGDFGKYALLNALSCGDDAGPPMALGIVWYWVPNDEKAGGKFITYLDGSPKNTRLFKSCDGVLYEKLKAIVDSRDRRVTRIVQDDVLPAARAFFDEPVAEGDGRHAWLERALDKASACQLVFFDPDNGIKGENANEGSLKYVYLEEIALFAAAGRSVVIYHHLGRRGKHKTQIDHWLAALRERFPERSPFAMWYHRGTARALFVVPSQALDVILRKRAAALAQSRWGEGRRPHFEFVPGK